MIEFMHKIFNRLTFRCFCALLIGGFIVTMFSGLLSLYGESQETVVLTPTRQVMKFPENENMLNDVTSQLAREGEALSNIAPAAGDASPQK